LRSGGFFGGKSASISKRSVLGRLRELPPGTKRRKKEEAQRENNSPQKAEPDVIGADAGREGKLQFCQEKANAEDAQQDLSSGETRKATFKKNAKRGETRITVQYIVMKKGGDIYSLYKKRGRESLTAVKSQGKRRTASG